MEYDPRDLEEDENRRIMRSATTPRPIGWISTTSEDGVDNLAPFSHYNNVSTSHPAVMFSPGTDGTGDDREFKHTGQNVMATGEFVVNVVSEDLLQQMLRTSDSVPREESEFDYADVERAPSTRVSPPRVAQAQVNLECRYHDSMDVWDNRVIVGEVVYMHVADEAHTDGKIDMKKLRTVGRIGGPDYTDTEGLGVSYHDYY